MYACCFVTINTVTYSTCWPECQILFFNFDLLHTVRNSWPVFQRKLSRRRLLITVVYFVSHTSARALRLITFTQRSRTTRHLFSIQFLWKPKILNVKDKRTKFERSKGDLGQFSESCNWPLTRAQLNKHMDLRCFKKLVDGSYNHGFETIRDLIGVWTMHWYAFSAPLSPEFGEFFRTK